MGEKADGGLELVAIKGVRVGAGRARRVQLIGPGKRKLFNNAAKTVFLEYFAATCNTRFAAGQAGVCVQTVWKHRMSDPQFRDAYQLALDQGYARIEAKIIETVMEPMPIEIDGDWEVPELEIRDPALFHAMLREHRQREAARAAPDRRRRGPKPRVANEEELRAALVRRLRVFGVRVGEGEGEG